MYSVVFLGNESSYLDTLYQHSNLKLIVGEGNMSKDSKEVFGCAVDFAQQHKIPTQSPKAFLEKPLYRPDLILVAGFSRLIPKRIIDFPKKGTLNIHQSLLPKLRGRHPLNWTIVLGEKKAGVTIHHMSEEFDQGNIILQKGVRILEEDNIMTLHWKTVRDGNLLLKKILKKDPKVNFKGTPQDESKASYFPVRKPEDGKVDWTQSGRDVFNLFRALTSPYPGAYFFYKRKKWILDQIKLYPLRQKAIPTGQLYLDSHQKVWVNTPDHSILIQGLRQKSLSELQQSIKK